MNNDRCQRGLEKLAEVDGQAGFKVIESLADICPDLAKYTVEFPFGDIYQRDGLDLKSRELITISALTALGNCAPQLAVHINGALNVGCEPNEITEAILQIAVYAGFPAALNGMFIAKDIFIDKGIIQT